MQQIFVPLLFLAVSGGRFLPVKGVQLPAFHGINTDFRINVREVEN